MSNDSADRRLTSNLKGKLFAPKLPYGPRPQPSATFSYDHNACRTWFDTWLRRGGTVARDCVYIQRARDFKDLRTFDERVKWARLAGCLNLQRGALRRQELSREISVELLDARRSNVVSIKTRKPK